MKIIELTKGKKAFVDDADYEYLMQWKWGLSNNYATRKMHLGYVDRKRKVATIYMHRVVNQTPDGFDTDHINGDKLDNRKENLRTATPSQNKYNIGAKGGSSKYKGVSYSKQRGKWVENIRKENKVTYLGCFENEDDAALAYNQKANEFHGEFALLNEINK